MLILVKNDQANMRKTRDAATAAHLPTGSVRALLEDEVSRGMHEQSPHPEATNASTGSGTAAVKERSAILYDPSAAISLLWLLRSLKFTVVLMQRLEAAQQKLEDERAIAPLEEELYDEDDPRGGTEDPTAEAVRGAYDTVIRPYHSWLLRKTFDIVSTQVPNITEAIGMLGPGLGDAERERKVFDEIRFYISQGLPLVELLENMYAELRLEDLRQV